MPGREDLIQQNRAAVRARAESAGEQEATGGEKPVYSSHRSLLGGNLDVASALENIEFAVKGPLGDGALRNSVAYIRYWSRPGSKATAETSSQTVDATQLNPLLDPQSQLYNQIANKIDLDFNFFPKDYDPTPFYTGSYGDLVSTDWYSPSNATSTDEDGNLVKTENQVVFSVADTNRQKALAQEIPSTKADTGAVNTNIVGSSSQADTGTESSNASRQSGVGQIKPANPNGFVNTISKIGRSVLGLPPSQIGYQGAAGAAQGGKAPLASGGTLAKGMWQFLFNPSELEIAAGPEFKAAETWGVSDKANSGQPLNWSHNKNTELKFNSVLLNGYVFGRKVEELEQGIFELFMARDGEGQAGPPILEFVWGKRVFGPCVIKEISIKEKMWDEGMVVNAELSFTLEQIPEWTINDGYVDVARPGKIPMVYDATEDNGGNVGAGSTAPSSPSDPGNGDNPDQKAPAPAGQKSGDGKLCDWALNISKQFQQLYVKLDNPQFIPYWDIGSLKNQFYNLKNQLYTGSSEIGGFVDSKLQTGCKRNAYKQTVEDILKSKNLFVGGFTIDNLLGRQSNRPETRAYQFMRGCTESTKRAIDEWQRTSEKCKAQREAGDLYRQRNGTKEQQELCAKYTGRCSTPGARFGTGGQCPFVNNNRGVICSGGVWTPL